MLKTWRKVLLQNNMASLHHCFVPHGSWMQPACEYYKFGHDPTMSALEQENNDGKKDLHLQDAKPQLSIFMSGTNDGRLDEHSHHAAAGHYGL
jgi:hypothetical protein